MNRLDWHGNPNTPIRRGETFEIDDIALGKSWVDMGYVSQIEEQEVGVVDAAPADTKKTNTKKARKNKTVV